MPLHPLSLYLSLYLSIYLLPTLYSSFIKIAHTHHCYYSIKSTLFLLTSITHILTKKLPFSNTLQFPHSLILVTYHILTLIFIQSQKLKHSLFISSHKIYHSPLQSNLNPLAVHKLNTLLFNPSISTPPLALPYTSPKSLPLIHTHLTLSFLHSYYCLSSPLMLQYLGPHIPTNFIYL